MFATISKFTAWCVAWLFLCAPVTLLAAGDGGTGAARPFPIPLTEYSAPKGAGLWEILSLRAQADWFNVLATVIFALAILHTFLAPRLMKISHRWRHEHQARNEAEGRTGEAKPEVDARGDVDFKAEVMHFLGEIEVVFGLWTVPLLAAIAFFKDWKTAEHYISHGVNFTEPMFVVIVMTIAATRPILKFAERCLRAVASIGGETPWAWWAAILTLGPVLGSFITEPAAMTICAALLGHQFYRLGPGARLRYATLGLLFVNVSVGGTLTHFAAPPVLMVATKWGWGMAHMFEHFGWKALLGIVLCNGLYLAVFWRELRGLTGKGASEEAGEKLWDDRPDAVPGWIVAVHAAFLGWTVFTAHYPALFIGGFLFFLGFMAATQHYQNSSNLRPSLLVGFFLAGLVVHGGLQGWWIAPLLGRLGETQLMIGAAGLTAFNDNAAITYLASLVPDFSAGLKYAVVAGAVAGGGLTVIANAPNPAGQAILAKYFPDGVSPIGLALGALVPTVVMVACFLVLR